MPLAVALLSGGLDSMLAVRILQEQGFEVEALNIRTTFECCTVSAARAAAQLGVRQTVLDVDDNYVEVLRNPRYGYGKAVNPCVDCRIHMASLARRFMERVDARVVVTGEVLGQRPMSQKRNDLEVIALRSGLRGRLLRPLSAKLLEPTLVEREGWVDREKLYAFHGRARTGLIALARQLGIDVIPGPSTGCALTEKSFAPRVHDLLRFVPKASSWDFELLNVGRHVRIDQGVKAVIGRHAQDNAALRVFASRKDASESAHLEPEGFVGPDALLVGNIEDSTTRMVGAMMARYGRRADCDRTVRVRVTHRGASRVLSVDAARDDSIVAGLSPL